MFPDTDGDFNALNIVRLVWLVCFVFWHTKLSG